MGSSVKSRKRESHSLFPSFAGRRTIDQLHCMTAFNVFVPGLMTEKSTRRETGNGKKRENKLETEADLLRRCAVREGGSEEERVQGVFCVCSLASVSLHLTLLYLHVSPRLPLSTHHFHHP